MAMKERYYTVDGQIVGYKKSGVRKDFLTDALGSVTAEVDQTGNAKTFDGRYKPYGVTISSKGSRGSYGWIGTRGYRDTGLTASSTYVRARHYSASSGARIVTDPLWPRQSKYIYVEGRVPIFVDPSGLEFKNCKDVVYLTAAFLNSRIKMNHSFCKDIDGNDSNFVANKELVACFNTVPYKNAKRDAQCMCDKINESQDTSSRFSCEDDKICSSSNGCQGACACTDAGDCKTYICPQNKDCDTRWRNDWSQIMLHETLHCCGVQHTGLPKLDPIEDCIRAKFKWLIRPIWTGWGAPGENNRGDATGGGLCAS